MGLVPDKAYVTGPNKFSKQTTSCLDAQAYKLKDRDTILKVLLNNYDREEIDGFVHQFRTFQAFPTLSKPDKDGNCNIM